MTKQVFSGIAVVCLAFVLAEGCSKKMPSIRETARAVVATVTPKPSQPPLDEFTAPGDHWDDADGVPWAVARSMGQMCRLSYAEEAEVDETLSRWGFSNINHFRSGSLYACVASDDETVLIAFRGTDDMQDWLVNSDAVPQPVAHGLVHRGFYEGMRALYPQTTAAAIAHGAEHKDLWITGHSLGGALAVAFAYESLALGSLQPAGVVTFGQPLVADSAVGAYVSSRLGGNYVRLVNERDVVTRVPPGYVHFGKLIWFHEGKLQVEDPRGATTSAGLAPLSSAEFESLRQSFRNLRQLGEDFDPSELRSYGEQVAAVTDHLMDAYLGGIDARDK